MQNVFTKKFRHLIDGKEHLFLAFNSFDVFYGVAVREIIDDTQCGNGVFFKFPMCCIVKLNNQSWESLLEQAIEQSKNHWLEKLATQPREAEPQLFHDTFLCH
ncbi:hypothetical protein WAE56_17330 [Iodobacter sp. LRB]|uniref:hypothetical protein n=1 Tax=unclassified Iodobacter TaxID=235634 RepID=UPI000C0CD69E|nr:hypothetical protein [Iodobacter sp. BJB302]PHV00230.1 hypothetical protein CSQ88_18220 [Iodobacter sp. BJB302]